MGHGKNECTTCGALFENYHSREECEAAQATATTQTWRVVLDDGATKDVSVVSFGLLRWVVSGVAYARRDKA